MKANKCDYIDVEKLAISVNMGCFSVLGSPRTWRKKDIAVKDIVGGKLLCCCEKGCKAYTVMHAKS